MTHTPHTSVRVSRRNGPRIKRRLTIVHSVSRHHRVSSATAGARRPRCGAGQFASVERETGVESGRAAAVAPDRYNKWDNDITGTPGSRARPGPNVIITTFGSPARSLHMYSSPSSLSLSCFLATTRTLSSSARGRVTEIALSSRRKDRYFRRLRNMGNDSLHLRRRTRELFPYA